jgi:hypothetical protein
MERRSFALRALRVLCLYSRGGRQQEYCSHSLCIASRITLTDRDKDARGQGRCASLGKDFINILFISFM